MKKDLIKYIASQNISVTEAMKMMDENGRGVLVIVDDKGRLVGTLSDGDIRRWIIKTGELGEEIGKIIQKNPRYIFYNESVDVISFMIKQKIRFLPILDLDHRVVDIAFDSYSADNRFKENGKKINNGMAIIMAGGEGKRLHPYTKIIPKPLIPIGEIPILMRIMDKYYEHGVDQFYVIVNYKKEMIKAFFADQITPYRIIFIDEDKPLGTAGGISLIDKQFDSPVFVTNCDVLIEGDYLEMLDYHIKNKNKLTLVSSLRDFVIPYGVIHSGKDGRIQSLDEKPSYSFLFNTGMYIVDPDVIHGIPSNKYFHMTDLIENLIAKNEKIGMYPVSEGAFLDMGEFSELSRMEKKIRDEE